MSKTPKTDSLFAKIEALYHSQHYRSGDYCATVNALHELLFGVTPYTYGARLRRLAQPSTTARIK